MKIKIDCYFRMMTLLTAFFIGLLPVNVGATLPLINNPLPEMLKKVVPGVVNISTRTRIRYEENPLFRDPFFVNFLIFRTCLRSGNNKV